MTEMIKLLNPTIVKTTETGKKCLKLQAELYMLIDNKV